MAIKNSALTINFYARDNIANAPKTGDSGNFTMRIIKDGGSATAPTNSVSEPDSTNMPGVYELALTASEMNANFITVSGVSSTSDIEIIPVFIQTEQGDIAGLQSTVDDIETDTQDLQTQIGTAGAGLTDLGGMSTSMKAEINTEVADVLKTDTISELTTTPGANPTFERALMMLYMALRNEADSTDSVTRIKNNSGSVVSQATITESASQVTRGKYQDP